MLRSFPGVTLMRHQAVSASDETPWPLRERAEVLPWARRAAQRTRWLAGTGHWLAAPEQQTALPSLGKAAVSLTRDTCAELQR